MIALRLLGILHGTTVGGDAHDLLANWLGLPEQGQRVAVALAHLLAVAAHHKAVPEDRLGQRQLGRHEHRGPDDAVEPDDVLADDMHVGRPVFRPRPPPVLRWRRMKTLLRRRQPSWQISPRPRMVTFLRWRPADQL